MRCTPPLRNALLMTVLAASGMAVVAIPAVAVEMFTYFGDGSHIGLPSLEVPIEAYPGIPLRSDRLRARRAGKQTPRGTVGRFQGRGITIRVPVQQTMPAEDVNSEPPMPGPVPAGEPTPADAAAAIDISPETLSTERQVEATEARAVGLGSNLDFGGLREFSAFEESR